jgi:hypothetical protein
VLTRRANHPASAPSTNPASAASGMSAVTLTRMPSASPITAPTIRKNHVPLAPFMALIATAIASSHATNPRPNASKPKWGEAANLAASGKGYDICPE